MYRDSVTQNELNVSVSEDTAEITGLNSQVKFQKDAAGRLISQYGSVLEEKQPEENLPAGFVGCILRRRLLRRVFFYQLPGQPAAVLHGGNGEGEDPE